MLLRFIKKNKIQISKFAAVGFLASLLNFIIYSILIRLDININIASIFAYFVGLMISFIFSKKWVFNNKNNFIKTNQTFFIFLLIYLIGCIGMTLIINLVYFSINNHEIAWFLGVLYAAINNYLGSKYFVFKD